jgi:hypothetical protein
MKQSNRKFLVLLMIAVLAAAILCYYSFCNKGRGTAISSVGSSETVQNATQPEKSAAATATVKKASGPSGGTFRSKQEIKERYGRIEIATLQNGRVLEGAVISTGEFYTMVTSMAR